MSNEAIVHTVLHFYPDVEAVYLFGSYQTDYERKDSNADIALLSAHSSSDLFMSISDVNPQWMRIQLCRVFRKYVSPETPVEMLKKKSAASKICSQFGRNFRYITEVQQRFSGRPLPDEALCAILWEYKDRGKKGYDLTERLFAIMREHFPGLRLIGPERAGKDILMGELFEDYPKPDKTYRFRAF